MEVTQVRSVRDVAHPLENENCRKIEGSLIGGYREVVAQFPGGSIGDLRGLGTQMDRARIGEGDYGDSQGTNGGPSATRS